MASSLKKAIVRSFSGEPLAGYLPLDGFAGTECVTLLDLAGNATSIPLASTKWICFVRQFDSGEPLNPERLLRKTFPSRPRMAGIWIRLVLRDGDGLEGLAANDASLLGPAGLFLTPPDIRSNTQRLFLPRTSITQLEAVAVIGVPLRRKSQSPALIYPELQDDLFPPS